jgi:hypothetical protein
VIVLIALLVMLRAMRIFGRRPVLSPAQSSIG